MITSLFGSDLARVKKLDTTHRSKYFSIAFSIFLFLFLSSTAFSQNAEIYGIVKSKSGEAMPYTNVVILGKAIGTSTNYDGEYSLKLVPGNYKVSYQFIGYKSQVREISLKANERLKISPILSVEKVLLNTVQVNAKAENPAYEIIRNAQERRSIYLKEHENIKYHIYTKLFGKSESNGGGTIRFFGTTLTPSKGVFYLSESVNQVYQYDIDNMTETLEASLVLGDTSTITENNSLFINLYQNRPFSIGSQFATSRVVSPIANDGFGFYDYDYLGTFEEAGESIHKIKIIPKMKGSSTFEGDLYIIDGSWRVFKSHLFLKSIIGEIEINTQYIGDDQADTYLPFSSSFITRDKGDGTEIYYHNIFYDYLFEARVPEQSKLLSKVVSKEGIQKSNDWWKQTRPIELTDDERRAYQYINSLEENIFQFKKIDNDSLLFSLKKEEKKSPLQLYQNILSTQSIKLSDHLGLDLGFFTFNTIEGGVLKPHLRYSNEFSNGHKYSANAEVRYGFASNTFYYRGGFNYEVDPSAISEIGIAAGKSVDQISGENSISNFWNLSYSLSDKLNYLRLYQNSFASLYWKRELFNGLDLEVKSSYNLRVPLQNNTNYTWYDEEEEGSRDYMPNQAFIQGQYRGFESNSLWETNILISYQFRRKFELINGRKIALSSKYPTIKIGLDVGNLDSEYLRLWSNISDSWDVGALGFSKLSLSHGQYLTGNNLTPIDFFHFMGNQTIVFQNQRQFGLAYQLLDYYQYSTDNYFTGANFEHDFDGAILGRVPFLKKIGLKSYLMANYLQTAENPRYSELGIGLSSSFFPIRLNYYFGFENENFVRHGFILHTAF